MRLIGYYTTINSMDNVHPLKLRMAWYGSKHGICRTTDGGRLGSPLEQR